MHRDHPTFLEALHAKRRVSVRFFSRKENRELEKTCAPMDFGPLRGALDTQPRYQFWDLLGKRKPLNVAVLEEDLREVTLLEGTFDPAEIITWAFKAGAWSVARAWGDYS